MSCTWTELEAETLTLIQISHLVTSIGQLATYLGNKVTWFPVLRGQELSIGSKGIIMWCPALL